MMLDPKDMTPTQRVTLALIDRYAQIVRKPDGWLIGPHRATAKTVKALKARGLVRPGQTGRLQLVLTGEGRNTLIVWKARHLSRAEPQTTNGEPREALS